MKRSYAHGAHAGNGKVRTGLLPNMSGGRFGSKYFRLHLGLSIDWRITLDSSITGFMEVADQTPGIDPRKSL
jgi:hypothetical protein